MVLLLSIKDRATAIAYEPNRDALQYLVDGTWHELVPPPKEIGPSLLDLIRDLSRPRGMRAWTIRRLRGLIHRWERPYIDEDSHFFLRVHDELIRVRTSSTSDWSLLLHLDPKPDLSEQANELLEQCLAAHRERRNRDTRSRPTDSMPEGPDTE